MRWDESHIFVLDMTADVLMVSNNAYRLNTLNGFGTRSRLDAGVLGVVTVTVNRARSLSALISADSEGHVERYPGYQEWVVPEFEVHSKRELLDIGIDGEAVRPARPPSLPPGRPTGAQQGEQRGATGRQQAVLVPPRGTRDRHSASSGASAR